MSVAQEIKARLDIVEYVQQYVPLKKSGRHYKACCPFHSEKTPSFIVNSETQSWRCFGACSEGGDIFNFAMKLHGWDFRQALEELGRLAGVEVRQQTPQQREQAQHEERLRDILRTAAEAFHSALLQDAPDSQAVLQYAVERRGFSLETIEKYQIGFAVESWDNLLIHLREIGYRDDDIVEAGLAIRNDKGRIYDRFRNRLIIPIRDERGRVVGFGARALGDEHPKYLNSPQTPVFDKSRLLFGLDMARESIRQSGMAIVVEGYMDVIQAHQAGYMNVVAQMGTALTEAQLKLIAPRHAQRIILALDADEAGQNAMRRSLEVARQVLQDDYAGQLSVDIRILQIPGAKDPDDFLRATPEQWPQLIEAALPIADFIINLETEKLPPDASIQERERAARAILPLLYASEDNLYRKANIQKLAMRLRIQEADLLAWAEEQRRIDAAKPPLANYEQPPSLDELPPPPLPLEEDDASEAITNAPPPQPRRRTGRWAAEMQCLRILLRNADLYYALNRTIRELANNDELLLKYAFSEFCEDDFIEPDYRQIMARFLQSLQQETLETQDFIVQAINPMLEPTFQELLQEEAVMVQNKAPRLAGEFEQIWGDFNRFSRRLVDPLAELTAQALQLRQSRIERELKELRWLLQDGNQTKQTGARHDIHEHIATLVRAKHLIDAAIAQHRNMI